MRISDELIDEVIKYVRVGVPGEVAAQAAGVLDCDYRFWIREGASPHHLDLCPDCDFALFYRAVMQAEAQTEAEMTACILKSAHEGDWRAAAWWLERRFPHWAAGNASDSDLIPPPIGVSIEDLEAKLYKILRQSDSDSN